MLGKVLSMELQCIFLFFPLLCTVFIVSAVKCPYPKATNAIFTGAVFKYECQAGQRLVGSPQLTCGSDGQWSSDPPVCQDACRRPLGIESGDIPDEQLTASSVYRNMLGLSPWHPYYARLNKGGRINAWSAAENDQLQWLQVDLGRQKSVSGIITQGAKNFGTLQYVSAYKVRYSRNGYYWHMLKDAATGSDKIFEGNKDNITPKENMFSTPLVARFVRIVPWEWNNHITIRMELLGCDK